MDTLFSTRLQLEAGIEQLAETLERFARDIGSPFTDIESAWLRLEHSGELPPLLGSLNDQQKFESRVRSTVLNAYKALQEKDPPAAKRFRELVDQQRSTAYAAQLAELAIEEVTGEPIAKDVGRFAMLFLGQGMRILGLALIVFVLLAFFGCC